MLKKNFVLCSSPRGQNDDVADSSSSRYRNFNLNRNHHCASESPLNDGIGRTKTAAKWKDNTKDGKNYSQKGKASWKSVNVGSKNDGHITGKNSRSWNKKEEVKKPGNTSSTLSLHIANFEKAQEADNLKTELSSEKDDSKSMIKRQKVKFNFSNAEMRKIQSLFEVPRQGEQDGTKPEVMLFKASQKLFNPNRPATVTPECSDSQPDMNFASSNLNNVSKVLNETGHVSNPPTFLSRIVQQGFHQDNCAPPGFRPRMIQQGFHHNNSAPPGFYPRMEQAEIRHNISAPPGFYPRIPQDQQQQYYQMTNPVVGLPHYSTGFVSPGQFGMSFYQHGCPPQQHQNYQQRCHPQMIPPQFQPSLTGQLPLHGNGVVHFQQDPRYVNFQQLYSAPLPIRQHMPSHLSPRMQPQLLEQVMPPPNSDVAMPSPKKEVCDKFHNQVLDQIQQYKAMVDPKLKSETSSPSHSVPTEHVKKGSAIDWSHPQVKAVMEAILNGTDEALSHNNAAKAISKVLNREITKPTVQARLKSMKKKKNEKAKEKNSFGDGKKAVRNVIQKLENIIQKFAIYPRPSSSSTRPPSPSVSSHLFNNPLSKANIAIRDFEDSFKKWSDGYDPGTCDFDNPEYESQPLYKGRLSNSTVIVDEKSEQSTPSKVKKDAASLDSTEKQKSSCKEETAEQLFLREGLNNRLNRCLLMDEDDKTYQYTYQNQKDGKMHYCCSTCRSQPAPRSNITIFVDGSITIGEHSPGCTPLSTAKSMAQQEDRWGRLQVHQGMDPYAAFLEVFKNAKTKNVDSQLPCNYAFFRKQYGRWHQQRYEHCTMTSIAEAYRTLYGAKTRWLDFSDEKLAVFATDDSYRQMAMCKILVGDATFATSPEGIQQVFVMHGLVENDQGAEWVPLLLAIMAEKTEANYQKVMDTIQEAWNRLDIEPLTERVHCDYEAAEGNALKNLFGIDKIFGCYFHYNQIIIRKLDHFKFKYAYLMMKGDKAIPEYRSIRTWIRCLMALPLLPKEQGKFLWESVLHELPKPPATKSDELYWPTAEMEKFKAYFVKNWIGRKDNMFNFFGMGRVKNTNRAEAHHSSQRKKYKTHPSLKEYIHNAQIDYTLYDTRLRQLAENCKTNPRNKKYEKLEQILTTYETKLLDLLDDQDLTVADRISILYGYCRRVSYLMYDIRKPLKKKKTEKGKKVTVLQEEANDTFIWKKDLNFTGLTSDHHFTISKTEESMHKHGFVIDDEEFIETEKQDDLNATSFLINDDDFEEDDDNDNNSSGMDWQNFVDNKTSVDTTSENVELTSECKATQEADTTVQLDDTEEDKNAFNYTTGGDHPEKLHLDRLKNNQYLDDVIIMKVLQELITGNDSYVLVDTVVWLPGFGFDYWGPEKQKNKIKLPTLPIYSETWERALVPINITHGSYQHWTLAIIVKSRNLIIYLDPFKNPVPDTHLVQLFKIGQLLCRSLCTLYYPPPNSFMSQIDGYNCGVIACLLARSDLQKCPPFYTQEQLTQWRRSVHDWLQQGGKGNLKLEF